MKWCMNFSAALLASLPLLNSCKHSTEPPISQPDTTTHNFSWQVVLLGDGNGSRLNDVAIIDEKFAYAVGDLYMNDSTGRLDPNRYNYAIWDGTMWSIRRLPYSFQGQLYVNPIRSLFSFGSDDVWFGGNGISRWTGSAFVEVPLPPSVWGGEWISRIWGRSSSDLYIVGETGSIAHYDGGAWARILSGMSLPIQDIWGSRDQVTGEEEILCIASSGFSSPVGKKLLRVRGTTVEAVSDSGLAYNLRGIWHATHKAYYVVGGGIFISGSLGPNTVWGGGPLIYTQYYTNAVRGSAPNDVFVVGDWGEVLHYNGSTWKSFHDQTGLAYGSYWSVAVKGDLVIAVGDNYDRAVVAVGRRRD